MTRPKGRPRTRTRASRSRSSNARAIPKQSENPAGVPIDAIIFGGRRATLAPLVLEALDWTHGTFLGAAMASETTAAATGQVGVVRRDPMAMKPFCGYHFGDYWSHWLSLGQRLKHPPKMFQVNWFRRDIDGGFMWPGFGDNLRVLEWIMRRCDGSVDAVDTPVGRLPVAGAISTDRLKTLPDMHALLEIDRAAWREELGHVEDYLDGFGDRVPAALKQCRAEIETRLRASE